MTWPNSGEPRNFSISAAIEELLARGELELASVTYLRGRSITGEFVIIDEAQNLELSTLKVI
ncbi:MAG: PhoH family protein, partial [Acidimicrobiia bacterium]|nr:PhoH family protein [Acidimicrobiia bacterium]